MATSAEQSPLQDPPNDLRAIVETGMHQLRNPLQTIVGFAEVLATHDDDLDAQVRSTAVDAIVRNAQRAARLVDDLDVAVGRDVERPVRAEPVDLLRVVTEVVNDSGMAEAVTIDVSPALRVRADTDHVTEILVNLLDNAIAYGDPPVEVAADLAGDTVEISIEDSGPGVPPDFVDDLFEMHARAGTTSDRPGKGVGLAVARRLARRNDGSLDFVPTPPGRGARFVLELPLHVEPRRPASPARRGEPLRPRPVIHDVEVHRRGTRTTASARLGVDDRTVTGEAAAEPTLESSVHAVVHATLRALESALSGATTFEVESLTVDRDPGGQIVVRVRAEHGTDSEELVGAAITHDDHIGAAVKATLGAVNRRFEHLARSAG